MCLSQNHSPNSTQQGRRIEQRDMSWFPALDFILFILLLLLVVVVVVVMVKPCCKCSVCLSYVSSDWEGEFPNLADWYASLLRESPTQTIENHVLNNIITANPANVEHMLLDRFDNYPKGKAFSNILHDLLGRGIFNVDGDLWRTQRKMASFELGRANVRSFVFGLIRAEIHDRLLPVLGSVTEEIDLQDVLRRFSFDCICKASFGLDPGCLELEFPLSEFARAFDAASLISANRATTSAPLVWKAKRLLRLGSERQLRDAVRKTHTLADEVIRARRTLATSSSPPQLDLLARFMGSTSDNRLLRDIVISFLLAGRDTVASALIAFFWLVSLNPRVERSILAEVDDVLSEGIEYGKLRHLHYLHAALSESMRLYPPVQFDSKFAADDDELPDGTFVRKGTRVTYHAYAMGRMESIWGPDCKEFRPERWLKDGVFVPQNPFKYPVFQAGFRVCLGKEIAFMQMKCVAVSILQNFHIETSPSCNRLKFSPGLTANVSGGLRAVVKPRERIKIMHHGRDSRNDSG